MADDYEARYEALVAAVREQAIFWGDVYRRAVEERATGSQRVVAATLAAVEHRLLRLLPTPAAGGTHDTDGETA